MTSQENGRIALDKIKEHEGILYKVCNTYCQHESDREDLAQEIIYQLLKSYHSYDPAFRFSTWMYRVALNVAITFYRKKQAGAIILYPEETADVAGPPDHSPELEHHIAMLQKFINGLQELDRALMLLYLESKSYREISDILGISETNVATKISRIKEKLKQKFSNENLP